MKYSKIEKVNNALKNAFNEDDAYTMIQLIGHYNIVKKDFKKTGGFNEYLFGDGVKEII